MKHQLNSLILNNARFSQICSLGLFKPDRKCLDVFDYCDEISASLTKVECCLLI